MRGAEIARLGPARRQMAAQRRLQSCCYRWSGHRQGLQALIDRAVAQSPRLLVAVGALRLHETLDHLLELLNVQLCFSCPGFAATAAEAVARAVGVCA